MTHFCHAIGCYTPVSPQLLMCEPHWRKVPPELKRAVWLAYRSGQEVDGKPSEAYLAAAHDVVAAVRNMERRRSPLTIPQQCGTEGAR